MTIPSPGHPTGLRRPFKLAALGTLALLLALALACGAAQQPQQGEQSTGQTSQVQPGQPAAPAQAGVASSTENQTGSMAQTGAGIDKTDKSMAPESGAQEHSAPMAAQETAIERPASAEVMPAKTEETQPEQMANVVEPAAQPEIPVAVPAVTQQEPAQPSNPGESAPSQVTEPTSPPAAAPEPTPVPAQQPTAIPVPEPLPPIGNQVGNRIPDFTLDLVGGATASSVSLVEAGKPTFLFFTSTT